jgi:hypothetical protein
MCFKITDGFLLCSLTRALSVLAQTIRGFGNAGKTVPSQPLLWGAISVNFKSTLIIDEGFVNGCLGFAE